MENKRFKLLVLCIVLTVFSFVANVIMFCVITNNHKDTDSSSIQYVLYVGTNDKDTNKAEISFQDCKEIVKEICLNYVDGCTISEADGIWKADNQSMVEEKTIVCLFDDAKKEQIESIADEIIKELNQNCILMEQNQTEITYYTANSN